MHKGNLLRVAAAILFLLFCLFSAAAESFEPLPMDSCAPGYELKDENFLSENEYRDDSIHVQIFSGRYEDTTNYLYAYIKISDPSQLRTAPAPLINSPKASFLSLDVGRGRLIARAANAVIAINGDYCSNSNQCHVVLRQSTQVRNTVNGHEDLLIIDKNGDFSSVSVENRKQYADFYEEHKDELYQVLCFGPMMVKDGKSVIPEDYKNNSIGAEKPTQRSAIAQLGPLEYMLVSTEGPQSEKLAGMTIYQFADLCEQLGREFTETGCRLAFNLDGGNSATMVFKRPDPTQNNRMNYMKINSVDLPERFISDIIYFASLVK